MTTHPLTVEVKRLARRSGFDTVGIVLAGDLAEGEQAVRDWVSQGFHGTMYYLENFQERKQRFLDDFGEIKSILVLGVNYFQAEKTTKTGAVEDLSGRVARYAWGKDYHRVIAEKHEILIAEMKALIPGLKAKSCVDTQPLPERYAAGQGGAGFFGKHTGILNQTFGPWLFLSEIVINIELEKDLPSEGDCGTCTHCQTVCPTGALDQDYRMDARRCISYLTIEYKGDIPLEMRPLIKDWIFGCDECLLICPFTSKSKETGWKEFNASEGTGPRLSMDQIFKIETNSQYEKIFRNTPLLRIGRKQLLRNACIVLGNSRNSKALPYLEKALRDKSELVRSHAQWAIRQITG